MPTVKTDRLYPLDRIRNIGIIAHIDAGKTTTTERILFYTGKSYKLGNIDEGTTVTDWMAQEKERGITIVSAAVTTFWTPQSGPYKDIEARINIIDTPGHVDFTAEVERSLRVLDGGVTVLDAEEGVQSQSETVWRQADKYKVPRICFINKMDKLGADYFATLKSIRDKLNAPAVPYNLPIGTENDFKGVVDLLSQKAYVWETGVDGTGKEFKEVDIPHDMKADVEKYRNELIEKIAETDDTLIEKYLGGETIEIDELKKALRGAVIKYKIVPVMAGSSLRNKGVQPLLDAIVEYLPSPKDIEKVEGENPKTKEKETRKLVTEEPYCGLAFKIKGDPETGQTIISGMGELHLEIIVDRMKREFSVNAQVGRPQVAYRETIKKEANGEGKYIRQSGGRGQYGHCFLKVEPKPRGEGYEFVSTIKG